MLQNQTRPDNCLLDCYFFFANLMEEHLETEIPGFYQHT